MVVSLRVAQDWLATRWGADHLLCIPEQVEELMGDRLRLNQYREYLLTDEGANSLSRRLEESQPPVVVSALLLRQWYVKYHPDGGPLRFENCEVQRYTTDYY